MNVNSTYRNSFDSNFLFLQIHWKVSEIMARLLRKISINCFNYRIEKEPNGWCSIFKHFIYHRLSCISIYNTLKKALSHPKRRSKILHHRHNGVESTQGSGDTPEYSKPLSKEMKNEDQEKINSKFFLCY